ncbi:MAG: DUF4783 domain-containing protein [Saprospiraceae bacterium]|nr:DUF4783 domain-containing protein [Saprospiraceae bacterium]
MKTILLVLSTSTFLLGQPNFSSVITAIKVGNVSQISNFMDKNVEVTVEEQDGAYSKTEATNVVKTFLSKNPPSNCTMIHSGAARDGASYYCIGNLSTTGNKFRIYIFFKKIASNYLIQEMRFEAD